MPRHRPVALVEPGLVVAVVADAVSVEFAAVDIGGVGHRGASIR